LYESHHLMYQKMVMFEYKHLVHVLNQASVFCHQELSLIFKEYYKKKKSSFHIPPVVDEDGSTVSTATL
jgi:hypothetical protein